jgi:hypothetical protein
VDARVGVERFVGDQRIEHRLTMADLVLPSVRPSGEVRTLELRKP